MLALSTTNRASTMRCIPICCLLLLSCLLRGQTAYDKSPIFVDLSYGMLPLSTFSVEMGGTVGYRVHPRHGIGVGMYLTAVSRRPNEQLQAYVPVVQWNHQLPRNWRIALTTGPVVGGDYRSPSTGSNPAPVPVVTGSGATTLILPTVANRARGGWFVSVQGGYHFRSGLTVGVYSNLITPVVFEQSFSFRGGEPIVFRRGSVGGGVRVGYHFPRNLYR